MIHPPRSRPDAQPSRRRRPTPHAPAGFTLLELLIVIVIISLLVALIFPAIGDAQRNVQVARVRTEIASLEQGFAAFKEDFGEYPPSGIVLYEVAADWANDSRSRGIIRTLWPQFDFTYAAGGGSLDLNLDGDNLDDNNPGLNERFILTGAECLAFFLGGVTNAAGAKVGFSKNPANPFSPTGTNRDGPYFEFDPGRLVDVDIDGVGEYLSPLSGQTIPYIYVSSYGGSGYQVADIAVGDDANNDSVIDPGEDQNNNGTLDGPRNMTQVYLQSLTTPWKSQTYQIICPSFDNQYGDGGPYDSDRVDEAAPPWGLFGDDLGPGYSRNSERDNITNFQTGMLAPN